MISHIDSVERHGPLYSIHWTDDRGKRGTTIGSTTSTHVKALLARAKREGVSGRDPKPRKSPARRRRSSRDPEGPSVAKLDRLIESVEREVRQMKHSLEKYASDPARYKPQLENIAHSASSIESAMRVAYRLTSGRKD